MTERKGRSRRFAVCISNKGYEASLERNKIYVYPADYFVAIEVPKAVEASLNEGLLG